MKKLLCTLLVLLTVSGTLFAALPTDKSSYLQHPEEMKKVKRGNTELYALMGFSIPRLGSLMYGGVGVNVNTGNLHVPVQAAFGVDSYVLFTGLEYEFLTVPFGKDDKSEFYIRGGFDASIGWVNKDIFGGLYGVFTLGVSFPVGNSGAWFIHLRPETGAAYGSWRPAEAHYSDGYYQYDYDYGIKSSTFITLSTGYRF